MRGLYMLAGLKKDIEINLGIYRDDTLGVVDLPPQSVERFKKEDFSHF